MSVECRYCGTENEDGAVECSVCRANLVEEQSSKAAAFVEAEQFLWQITCPRCGKKYNVDKVESRVSACSNCTDEVDKYEIADVAPVKVVTKPEETPVVLPVLTLTEIRKKLELKVTQDVIISRNESELAPELFSQDEYISNPHCRIFYEGDTWKIEDFGSYNKTEVNFVALTPTFSVVLHDGNYIRLADLLFKVTIQSTNNAFAGKDVPESKNEAKQTAEGESSSEQACTDNPVVWAVRCPVCGTCYQVSGPNERMKQCPGYCRNDDIDRYEIASSAPIRIKLDMIGRKWRLS